MHMGRPWKIPVTAEQRQALEDLAQSKDRREADRARAILWTIAGFTSERIAQLLSHDASLIRHWRSAFRREGIAGLQSHPPPGRPPRLAEAAQPVITSTLARPERWTIRRLQAEIERRTGEHLSCAWIHELVRKKGASATAGHGARPRTSRIPRR